MTEAMMVVGRNSAEKAAAAFRTAALLVRRAAMESRTFPRSAVTAKMRKAAEFAAMGTSFMESATGVFLEDVR